MKDEIRHTCSETAVTLALESRNIGQSCECHVCCGEASIVLDLVVRQVLISTSEDEEEEGGTGY